MKRIFLVLAVMTIAQTAFAQQTEPKNEPKADAKPTTMQEAWNKYCQNPTEKVQKSWCEDVYGMAAMSKPADDKRALEFLRKLTISAIQWTKHMLVMVEPSKDGCKSAYRLARSKILADPQIVDLYKMSISIDAINGPPIQCMSQEEKRDNEELIVYFTSVAESL